MKKKYRILIFLIISIQLSLAGAASAQPEANPDRTLSPYFLVKSNDPEVDQLPLKSTSAMVNISGVIADVTIVQTYKNEGHRPLEAVYVFPASTRAAVYGMKMTIGERTITANIRRREEARQVYEKAKQAGKSASLLEQHRPNVFQMNVANILAGDIIRVELKYTELLIPTDRVYEFVYPTVVGPRYSETPAASTTL
ncbi:MAG: VIT domain-containing protein [Planctomycetota bacterium]|jgi:Ca-activated chloride channel family protein